MTGCNIDYILQLEQDPQTKVLTVFEYPIDKTQYQKELIKLNGVYDQINVLMRTMRKDEGIDRSLGFYLNLTRFYKILGLYESQEVMQILVDFDNIVSKYFLPVCYNMALCLNYNEPYATYTKFTFEKHQRTFDLLLKDARNRVKRQFGDYIPNGIVPESETLNGGDDNCIKDWEKDESDCRKWISSLEDILLEVQESILEDIECSLRKLDLVVISERHRLAQSKYHNENTLFTSHIKPGFTNLKLPFPEGSDVQITMGSNFGYGKSSYWDILISYKGMALRSYINKIEYGFTNYLSSTNWYEVRRREATYYYKPDRSIWAKVLKEIARNYNNYLRDPERFVEEFVNEAINKILEQTKCYRYRLFVFLPAKEHNLWKVYLAMSILQDLYDMRMISSEVGVDLSSEIRALERYAHRELGYLPDVLDFLCGALEDVVASYYKLEANSKALRGTIQELEIQIKKDENDCDVEDVEQQKEQLLQLKKRLRKLQEEQRLIRTGLTFKGAKLSADGDTISLASAIELFFACRQIIETHNLDVNLDNLTSLAEVMSCFKNGE